MNTFKKALCRIYQTVFRLALPVLPYREPKLYGSIQELESLFAKLQVKSVLLVTDNYLYSSGAVKPLEDLLAANGIHCAVYDRTRANPTIKNVEEARILYLTHNCEALIAFGGGSSLDCAKAVGARIAYPKRSMQELKGLLRVLRRIPTLIAIPTTAGTGSEVTLAAVITDADRHYKYTMNDFTLIPTHAVLDPAVTYTLPPHLTATTGMDALTHAVEAYIGRSTTKKTRAWALEAVKLIFENIETAYNCPMDKEARANMLRASYLAGRAFTQSYVGYVHAVAHSLGGQYNIPHGLANSVLLPIVLEAYGRSADKKLHDLALAVGVAEKEDPDFTAAQKFIEAIRGMNSRMQIPETLSGIHEEDIPQMAQHADKEANPLYPVPMLMNAKELERFYYAVADWRK